MTRLAARRFAPACLLVAILVAGAGCTASDEAPTDDAGPPGTTVVDFCIPFPTRDAAAMLSVTEDPRLAGNEEFTDSLLEMGAQGLAERAPAAIKAQVDTYVEALRDYQPGVDPMDDPGTAAAVTDINAWLRANCGPPTATVPPATAPPGTTS